MSTLDQTIAGDLAALSADNRIRIPALEATLGALTPPRADTSAGAHELALLAAAQVYARRLARAVSGAAATSCVLALLVWLSNPLGVAAGSRIAAVQDHMVYAGPLEVVPWIALVVLATHLATLRIAERRVARVLAHPPSDALARLRQRARSLGGVAAALRVAGTASVVIALGLSWVSINLDRYSTFWDRDSSGVLELMRHAMIAAVFGTIAAASAIGLVTRSARLGRRLAHPAVTASGVVLGAATALVGFRFDVGPMFETFAFASNLVPSTALRIVLTITGSLAVLIVVGSAAVRRDRREELSLR